MKIIQNQLLVLLLTVALLYLVRCSTSLEPQSSGGDISVVDNKICGTIYDAYGKPAADVKVFLRPSDYLAEVTQLAKKASGLHAAVCSTTTDAKGVFAFSRNNPLVPALYALEALSSDRKTMLFIDSINIDSALLASDTWLDIDTPTYATTLLPSSVIMGQVKQGTTEIKGTVQVYGLNIKVPIGSDGTYRIESVPAGRLRLQVSISESGKTLQGVLNVKATSGTIATTEPLVGVMLEFNNDKDVLTTWHSVGDTVVIPVEHAGYKRDGFVFSKWQNNESVGAPEIYQPGDTLIVDTSAIELYAYWEIKKYLLTAKSAGNGKVIAIGNAGGMVYGIDKVVPKEISSDSAEQSVDAALIAVPEPGFQLHYWRVVEGEAKIADSSADTAKVNLTKGDAVVEAVFGAITFRTKLVGEGWQLAGEDRFIDQTDDGGYIRFMIIKPIQTIVGNPSDMRIRMVKLNMYGRLLWGRDLYYMSESALLFARKTAEGNYVLLTSITDVNVKRGTLLMVVNNEGSMLFSKIFTSDEIPGIIRDLCLTSSNDYLVGTDIMVVYDPINAIVVKISNNGDILWTDTLGKSKYIKNIYNKNDGTILAFENTTKGMMDTLSITNITTDGKVLWERFIPNQSVSDFENLIRENNTSFFTVRYTSDADSGGTASTSLITVTKISDEAEVEWSKQFVRQTSLNRAHLAGETDDGGYVFWEHLLDVNGYIDTTLTLTKYNNTGMQQWNTVISNEYSCITTNVQPARDGGYVINAGIKDNSDLNVNSPYLIKTDANGKIYR